MGGITKATENSEVMIGRRPLIKDLIGCPLTK